MGDVIDTLAELQIFLDSRARSGSLMARVKDIENKVSIKKGEEGYPTRDIIAKDTAFVVRSKEKIVKVLGSEKYMDVVCQLIKFLEQNPEKIEKKSKSENFFGISDGMMAGYNVDLTWAGSQAVGTTYTLTGYTFEDMHIVNQRELRQAPTPNISETLEALRRSLEEQSPQYGINSTVLDEQENNEGEEDGGR